MSTKSARRIIRFEMATVIAAETSKMETEFSNMNPAETLPIIAKRTKTAKRVVRIGVRSPGEPVTIEQVMVSTPPDTIDPQYLEESVSLYNKTVASLDIESELLVSDDFRVNTHGITVSALTTAIAAEIGGMQSEFGNESRASSITFSERAARLSATLLVKQVGNNHPGKPISLEQVKASDPTLIVETGALYMGYIISLYNKTVAGIDMEAELLIQDAANAGKRPSRYAFRKAWGLLRTAWELTAVSNIAMLAADRCAA